MAKVTLADDEVIIFHGRFQPFHVGHEWILRYLIENTSNGIVIGIVNPDPWDISVGDDPSFHRFTPNRNPLTFWERYQCIYQTIRDSGYSDRILGIVPLPRPSVNFEKCKRFIPKQRIRFVILIRYPDETEKWKKERYSSNGFNIFEVPPQEVPKEIIPVSGTLLRNLMCLNDPIWKQFVPPCTHAFLDTSEILDRMSKTASNEDAFNEISQFAKMQYTDWSKKVLGSYLFIRERKEERKMKAHKHDIIGAIAESLFFICPPLKGLLRLRDKERLAKKEQETIQLIKQQSINTIDGVEKIIEEKFGENKLLAIKAIRNDYANALLIASEGTEKYDNIMSSLKTGGEEVISWRKSFGDNQYLETLVELYDTNIDDLWILVRDYGFDPSKVKGTTTRSRIRSFMQNLARLDTDKIISILGAIYNEHEDEDVFKQTYIFSKAILE